MSTVSVWLPWGSAEVSAKWGLALALINWGEDHDWSIHIHLGWPNMYIPIPLPKRDPKDIMDRWGFHFFDDAIHLNRGSKTKVVKLPWAWGSCVRHEVMCPDGSWAKHIGPWEHSDIGDGREMSQFPYSYALKSGEVQNRTATVYVDRRAWRRKWLKWTRIGEKARQTICIEFNDEVGEHTGSWKGGCIGCSYEMLSGETPEQTLRRMEKVRTF